MRPYSECRATRKRLFIVLQLAAIAGTQYNIIMVLSIKAIEAGQGREEADHLSHAGGRQEAIGDPCH